MSLRKALKNVGKKLKKLKVGTLLVHAVEAVAPSPIANAVRKGEATYNRYEQKINDEAKRLGISRKQAAIRVGGQVGPAAIGAANAYADAGFPSAGQGASMGMLLVGAVLLLLLLKKG